nr:retrovirus-related Pol polyprotein from transposon TNT 1-94 [Tanacetum cinerariifolium]
MTGNLKLLINFIWKFMGTVRFENDHVAAILGFGDLQWGYILITRVYFVKRLGYNLFSVGQFCDSDLEVAFRRNACFVRNLEGVDLLKGDRSTNLYTINLHEMASASPICLMAHASSTKSWLWHQRLSHLNFNTINDLTRNELVAGLPKFKYHKEHLCPSCEQGKSKRASHPLKPVPNSRQRLHLLHMDLCGPMRIASINGKRYVLVIVDDYSRYTWVHFLRSKDEALEVIITFLKRITVLLQGVGHYARNCTVRPRRRDAAYLQTQLLIAQKEEAGIQLQAEEYDLMAAAADLDEIEEFLGTVRFENDHIAAILGFGDLQWGNILITRVYFVEGLGHNLFSVGQFYDSDLEVAFRRNACFVRNLKGVDLLKGDRSTNLYTINLHEMASASPIYLMARASSTKSWLWHQRLSHLNFDSINDLARNDLVSGLLKFKYHKEHLCPSCEQGKRKRASHPPKPVPNSRQRLHLFHMDLCGPMRIASINGKRYVLVIVDDYSRYTWIHFLKSKDEAPEVIITFLKRITVLLRSPVIIIRTDNGTKFKNQVLKEYFDTIGISHQMYSVRTPQQNRVVERRNRTLIEAARTMLIFSCAPLFLWAEAIPTKTGYLISLCIRCSLLSQDDRKDIRKLGAKGVIGFFIGYSADSCAYRIYNRRTKKIIETMNVSFDELSAMEFEQRSSKPGLQSMTSGQISSGLDLTYAPSTITTQQPSEGELDLLFEAMYDDYISGQPSATARTVPPAQEPQDVNELNSNAMVDGNTFVNPFANSSTSASASSSSQNVDPSNMHTFYQPYPYEFQWTKDHPLEQVIGEPSRPILTRNQLRSDGDMCMYALTVSTMEPKNIKEAMTDPAWIDSMHEEILQFNSNAIGTPMEIKDKLDQDHNGTPVDATKYRSMIGALMYVMSSRPDLVHATCLCARYQAKPTEKHLKEVKRIFHADYAGCKDTFKSTFSGAQFLGGKLLTDYGFHFNKILIYYDLKSAIAISCNSVQHSRTKHIVVRYHFIKEHLEKGTIELYFVKTDYQLADIFTKALPADRFNYLVRRLARAGGIYPGTLPLDRVEVLEYVSLSSCCAQVLWMRTQLMDYGFYFNKIPIYYDSKSTIAISCNPVQHSRTKHIAVRYHFIKEYVKKGTIELYFVKTDYQLADLFTKALPADRFNYLVRLLGMRSLSPHELDRLTKSHESQRDLPRNTTLDRVEVL